MLKTHCNSLPPRIGTDLTSMPGNSLLLLLFFHHQPCCLGSLQCLCHCLRPSRRRLMQCDGGGKGSSRWERGLLALRGESCAAPLVVVGQVVAIRAETFAIVDLVGMVAGPGALFCLLLLFCLIAHLSKVASLMWGWFNDLTLLSCRPAIAGHRTRESNWRLCASSAVEFLLLRHTRGGIDATRRGFRLVSF